MTSIGGEGYWRQFGRHLVRFVVIYLLAGTVASWLLRYLAWYRVCPPALAWLCSRVFEPAFVFLFGVW